MANEARYDAEGTVLAPLLRAADTLAAAPPAPAADALSRQSLIALPSSMVNDPPLARTRTAPAVPTALQFGRWRRGPA
ncbi:MAG: hypothetical protein V8S24_01470 [Gordonibacter pamelaeae]